MAANDPSGQFAVLGHDFKPVGGGFGECLQLGQRGVERLAQAAGLTINNTSQHLQQLRRAQPNISLDWLLTQMPIKEPPEMQHYIEGFRRAGLE